MDDFEVIASPNIIDKILLVHKVDILEVEEAFNNWVGRPLIDDRKQHRTNPPTIWFCAETTDGRILKIVGIPLVETKEFVLKSAYEASDWEINFYEENN